MQEDIYSKAIIISNLNTDVEIERSLINELTSQNDKLKEQINVLLKKSKHAK